MRSCKGKADREMIKKLVYEELSDYEIGKRLNRAENTIRRIRERELNIFTGRNVYFAKEWRNLQWRENKRNKVKKCAGSYVAVPLFYTKDFFEPWTKVCYKLTVEKPDKITIQFKREEEILDKRLIKKRVMGPRCRPYVNIVEEQSPKPEDSGT